jgi:acetolactate synthase-1/2/3 large subunit
MTLQLEKPGATTNRVRMKAAAALVRVFENAGCQAIFSIPGRAILPVFDAIREGGKIQSYVVRHEQTAAFAAEGYSRAKGPGVGLCGVTSGPASTNLVTGLYGAWFDSIPLIAMTGQVATNAIGTRAFQEAPTPEIVRPVTKAVFQPHNPEELPIIAHLALKIALTPPMGPVLLDLPLNVQDSVIELDPAVLEADYELPKELLAHYLPEWAVEKRPIPQPSESQIKEAADMLTASERPVIVAGGGVILAECWQELHELAEYLAIPVATAYMGKGSFPEDHPLALGNCGTMINTPIANKTLLEADLLIGLGNRWGDRHIGKAEIYAHDAKVIHVNLNPQEINKALKTDLGIAADLKSFLQGLIAELKRRDAGKNFATEPRIQQLQLDKKALARKTDYEQTPIKPQRAIADLRKALPRDAFVTHDCGISQIWSGQLFEVYEPRTYMVTGGAGTMGWGLGAAIGAMVAQPGRRACNLVGDGSIQMSLMDLASAVQHNIPILIFVLNNGILGLIHQQQNWYFGERYISTELTYGNTETGTFAQRGPDFAAIARAMGAYGETVAQPEEIIPAVRRALESQRPSLIEVLCDPEALCSMAKDGTLTGVIEAE